VYKHKSKRSVTFAEAPVSIDASNDTSGRSTKPARPILSLINTRSVSPAPSWHEEKLSADISGFVDMVKSHLAGVHSLKESHSSPSQSRNSPANSRPASRNSMHNDIGMDSIRARRRTMTFRPRFNPSSVQKLCSEALAEL
jgi:hypothetical protein